MLREVREVGRIEGEGVAERAIEEGFKGTVDGAVEVTVKGAVERRWKSG